MSTFPDIWVYYINHGVITRDLKLLLVRDGIRVFRQRNNFMVMYTELGYTIDVEKKTITIPEESSIGMINGVWEKKPFDHMPISELESQTMFRLPGVSGKGPKETTEVVHPNPTFQGCSKFIPKELMTDLLGRYGFVGKPISEMSNSDLMDIGGQTEELNTLKEYYITQSIENFLETPDPLLQNKMDEIRATATYRDKLYFWDYKLKFITNGGDCQLLGDEIVITINGEEVERFKPWTPCMNGMYSYTRFMVTRGGHIHWGMRPTYHTDEENKDLLREWGIFMRDQDMDHYYGSKPLRDWIHTYENDTACFFTNEIDSLD